VNNLIADHFGAERTPEVFLLDQDRVIRYRGRIDDQYGYQEGIGYERPEAVHSDLAVAIEELLAGKPVSSPVTVSTGCLIGRVRKPTGDSEITYASHVAAIFNARCVVCHRPGEVAPFSMLEYDDVVGWGEMIREVVEDNRMPPWHADPQHGAFSNDCHLSDEEKNLIASWVENGCPKGDPAKIPSQPQFVKGWQIDKPQEIFWAKPYSVPATGTVDYQYFTVDPGFTEDRWVQAAEARAGNPAVVHHIIVFVIPPGAKRAGVTFDGFLVATAPGARPMVLADGMAKLVPAGSKFLFQLHYTPNGSPQKDRSCVGLIYAKPDSVVTAVKTTAALNIIFSIPPNANDHPVDAVHSLRRDSVLLSLYPHMHLRGKAFRYTARYPDGKEEILLDVPRYDFNWQNTYELKEPKLLPKGTEIRCAARFDNSEANAANPDPTKAVRFGEQTYEEMMIGFFDIAMPRDVAEELELTSPRARKRAAAQTSAKANRARAAGSRRSLATGNP
jgi:mono/diheme cytochrome c family protein